MDVADAFHHTCYRTCDFVTRIKNIYIYIKYGLCLEPTYIMEFNTWYLGIFDACGKHYYICGSLEDICEQLTLKSLFYSYHVNNQICHTHNLEGVYKACINANKTGKVFTLTEYDKQWYSSQQIEYILKLNKVVCTRLNNINGGV